jgi:hypothetical protein
MAVRKGEVVDKGLLLLKFFSFATAPCLWLHFTAKAASLVWWLVLDFVELRAPHPRPLPKNIIKKIDFMAWFCPNLC